ncbi:hypothetical protein [Streptomyces sp. NPDC056948]|uniref:hypothetical protein n=1 Tax=Streptomyces sp. NPDC056948 TaxID=3345975 RepID=UPI00362AA689
MEAACLTLSPGPVRFQTVPQETVITSGEVEQAGALGEVARYRHDHGPTLRPGPQESAEEYARQWDQRMLASAPTNSSSTTATIEYAPYTIYEPSVYSSYLTTRLYYTQRDRT